MCKFYQGAEDKLLEKKLKRLFEKVHRDKPAASRSVSFGGFHCLSLFDILGAHTVSQESKESYFIALKRKDAPGRDEVFAE